MIRTDPDARPAWSTLHDLALLYLALAHGTDEHIDPAETRAMGDKLKTWMPAASPERIGQVLDDVMLVYVGGTAGPMLQTAIAALRETLPILERIAVLNDLADLASADGIVVPRELAFIRDIARQWDVEAHLR